jgi:cephalosporin hydroxylase
MTVLDLEQLNSERGEALALPPPLPSPRPSPEGERLIVDAFHQLYWGKRTWSLQWMGFNMIKWPADLLTYAELLHKNRPDVLIETGTYYGGSAQFFADCMDRIGKGLVISIDINPATRRPPHDRIIYLEGDSVALAPVVQEEITALAEDAAVMVSLDSDHRQEHVAKELEAYKDIVTPGQYLVVEDTNLNGHPVHPEHGPGPWEAVQEFNDPRFTEDEALANRHLFSMHTWLRKEATCHK